MAHATELTITTGRTHYGGDPQNDERILSRESRLSVTWRLGEDEQDLPLMASVLAEEAEHALEAAWQAAKDRHKEPCAAEGTPIPSEIAAPAPPVPSQNTGHPRHNGHGGGSNGNGSAHANGRHSASSCLSNAQSTGPARTASRRKRSAVIVPPVPAAGTPAMSPPQRLAIRALCHRMEVEDVELKLLLDERFGKRELDSLSKEEAGALLVALQQGEWEEAPWQPVVVN